MDNYLQIARKVLREARHPLSARQILRVAYQLQIVPRDLYGRTQHKTLQARLSTDILQLRSKSDFYRTGPGRFFLRSLLGDRTIPTRYRREYMAPLRAAQLGRFDVLAFPRTEVAGVAAPDRTRLAVGDLMSLSWRYARMEDLRRDPWLLPFRFLVVIVDDGRVVVSNSCLSKDGDFAPQAPLGVEGVVRREDRSLFSPDKAGLPDAAVRTLMQHLGLPRTLLSALEEASRWSAPIALYEEGEAPAGDDLIALLAFRCSGIPEVVEALDALATSTWLHLPIRVNDLDRFDRWSARLIGDASLQFAVCGRLSGLEHLGERQLPNEAGKRLHAERAPMVVRL
jgi:hypothetical protein